jgi:hypothetical protein
MPITGLLRGLGAVIRQRQRGRSSECGEHARKVYMESEVLWMDEEDLRSTCLTLSTLLQISEMNTVRAVNEALQYGYRQGYADAVVRISFTTKEGNAAGLVLH